MLNPFAKMDNIADSRTIACPVYDIKGNITRTDTITINGLGQMFLEGVRVALESVVYWIKRLMRGVVVAEQLVATISKKVARLLHIDLGARKIANHYEFVEFMVERPIKSLTEITEAELQDVLACIRDLDVAA